VEKKWRGRPLLRENLKVTHPA